MGFNRFKQIAPIESDSVTPLCSETTQFCLTSADLDRPDQVVNVTNEDKDVVYRFEKVASATIPNKFTRRWVLIDANNQNKLCSVTMSPFHAYIEFEDMIRNIVKKVHVKAKEKGLYRQFAVPLDSLEGQAVVNNSAVNEQIFRWSTKKYHLERILNAATSFYPSPDVVVPPVPASDLVATSQKPSTKAEIVAKCKKISAIPISFIIDLDLKKVGLHQALSSAFVTIVSNWRKDSANYVDDSHNEDAMMVSNEQIQEGQENEGFLLEPNVEQATQNPSHQPVLIEVHDEDNNVFMQANEPEYIQHPQTIIGAEIAPNKILRPVENSEILDPQISTLQVSSENVPISYVSVDGYGNQEGGITNHAFPALSIPPESEPSNHFNNGPTESHFSNSEFKSLPESSNKADILAPAQEHMPFRKKKLLARMLSRKCPVSGKIFLVIGGKSKKQRRLHSCFLGAKCPAKGRFSRRISRATGRIESLPSLNGKENRLINTIFGGESTVLNTESDFLFKLLQAQKRCSITGQFLGFLGPVLVQCYSAQSKLGRGSNERNAFMDKLNEAMLQVQNAEKYQNIEPHLCLLGKKCPVNGKILDLTSETKKENKKQKGHGLPSQCPMSGKCLFTGKLLAICPKLITQGHQFTPVNMLDQPFPCPSHQDYVVMPGNACIYCPSISVASDYCECPEHVHYACDSSTIQNFDFFESPQFGFQNNCEDSSRPVIVVNVNTCSDEELGKYNGDVNQASLPVIHTTYPDPQVFTNYAPDITTQCDGNHDQLMTDENCYDFKEHDLPQQDGHQCQHNHDYHSQHETKYYVDQMIRQFDNFQHKRNTLERSVNPNTHSYLAESEQDAANTIEHLKSCNKYDCGKSELSLNYNREATTNSPSSIKLNLNLNESSNKHNSVQRLAENITQQVFRLSQQNSNTDNIIENITDMIIARLDNSASLTNSLHEAKAHAKNNSNTLKSKPVLRKSTRYSDIGNIMNKEPLTSNYTRVRVDELDNLDRTDDEKNIDIIKHADSSKVGTLPEFQTSNMLQKRPQSVRFEEDENWEDEDEDNNNELTLGQDVHRDVNPMYMVEPSASSLSSSNGAVSLRHISSSSSDNSYFIEDDKTSRKLKKAVKHGILGGFEKVSKVAQVTGVGNVAEKVLGISKSGYGYDEITGHVHGNGKRYLKHRLDMEKTKNRSVSGFGSRNKDIKGDIGARNVVKNDVDEFPHVEKAVQKVYETENDHDDELEEQYTSDEENEDSVYDEFHNIRQDEHGNMMLHTHGHERFHKDSKKHKREKKHKDERERRSLKNLLAVGSKDKQGLKYEIKNSRHPKTRKNRDTKTHPSSSESSSSQSFEDESGSSGNIENYIPISSKYGKFIPGRSVKNPSKEYRRFANRNRNLKRKNVEHNKTHREKRYVYCPRPSEYNDSDHEDDYEDDNDEDYGSDSITNENERQRDRRRRRVRRQRAFLSRIPIRRQYDTWHGPSRVSSFEYSLQRGVAAVPQPIVPRHVLKRVQPIVQPIVQPVVQPIYQEPDYYNEPIDTEYFYEEV